MKRFSTVLAVLTLTAGAALADATMPATTTQQTVAPSTATTVTTTATCPVMPMTTMVMPAPMTYQVSTMPATVMGTTATTATQVAVCPIGMMQAPAPCAAKTGRTITDSPQVLVLGSEESYALSNLGVSRLNWNDTAMNSPSVFSQTNPLSNNMPNASIMRHGNPNFPYYAVDRSVRVAGSVEQFIATTTVPASSQSTLDALKNRYSGLTPQQAMAMGYAPLAACVQDVGYVYINQAMVDNRFDPMMPEAFMFDSDGKLQGVQFLLLSDVPFSAFGQPFQPSALMTGAMQLPVWLYNENPQGMFTLANPGVKCGGMTMAAPSMAMPTTTTTTQPQAPRQY